MKNFKLLLILITINCSAQVDLSMQISPYGLFANIEAMYPVKAKFIIGGEFGYNVINPDINFKTGLNLGYRITEMISTELDVLMVSSRIPKYDNDIEIALQMKITPPLKGIMFSLGVTAPVIFVKVAFGLRLDYLRLFKHNRRFYMWKYPFTNDHNPRYKPFSKPKL